MDQEFSDYVQNVSLHGRQQKTICKMERKGLIIITVHKIKIGFFIKYALVW